MVRLRKLRADGSNTLIIDYLDVIDADDVSRGNFDDNRTSEYTMLVKTLRDRPNVALEGAKLAAIDLLGKIDHDYLEQILDKFRIAVWNLDHEVDIAKISDENTNKLAQMVGIVLTRQDPLHYLKEACYVCENGHLIVVKSEGTEHWKPRECNEDDCGSQRLKLDEKKSAADVFQILRIQQGYDSAEPGVSRDIEVFCIGKDLVDKVKPGDFVVATGIIDVDRRNTKQQGNSLGKFRMECLWINKKAEEFVVDDPVLEKDVENAVIHDDTPEDKLEDEGFNRLVASICPSIKGNDVVRMALLLQLVGTDTKTLPDQTHIRGDINTLLCGDSACVVVGTKVVLGNGQIVDIETLGQYHLQAIKKQILTGEGNRKRAYATIFHKYEKKPVIEIVTETGKSIKGTYNHPLYVFNPKKREFSWKRLDEMQLGDKVVCVNKIPCTMRSPVTTNFNPPPYKRGYCGGGPRYHGLIPMVVDEDLAGLFGYIIGDGWVRKRAVGFIVSDKERDIQPRLLGMVDRTFGVKPFIYEAIGAEHECGGRIFVSRMPMITTEIQSYAVVNMLAFLRTKRVPELIFRSPDNVVASFLRWIFQADGTVFNNGRGRRAVVLTAKDIELLRDVQLLLLRFGINSRIQYRPSKHAANLSIRRGESIIKYARYIGFESVNKKKTLAELARAARDFQLHGQQRTEDIVNILYHIKPADVYDIEVPIKHRFIANGMISHNTGKSKMARFMLKCFNRAVFSVGRGSTTAGLKAAIVFDKLTGAARLEAGAYLLANGGVVYVDELEKTEKQQREDLAETMDDEQTITIHKATIHKEMSVRVASLHVCNPVNGGVWAKNKNIFENTGFEPWHLTRYDAIFVFMDEPDEEADRAKWTHYLKHYDQSITDADLQDNKKIALTGEDLKSAVFLRLWGQYVRRKFHPRLRPGSKAEEMLREEWIRLRQLSQKSYEHKMEEAKSKDEDPNDVERSQIISMREIGGLLRFAEASARAHHRNEVTEKDAGIAMSILSEFMTRAGFNPATGEMMVPYFQVKEREEDIMKAVKAQREKFRRIAEDLSLAPCPQCKRKKRIIDRDNSIDPTNPDIIDCPTCGARGLIEIEFREDDFVRECRDAKIPDKFINKQLTLYKNHGFFLDVDGKLKLNSKEWYKAA